MTDFRQIGQAREKQLGHKLDQIVSDSVSGQTNVDPTGYLTGLSSMAIKSTTEISDIKRATVLLTSLVTTHPDNPSGKCSRHVCTPAKHFPSCPCLFVLMQACFDASMF